MLAKVIFMPRARRDLIEIGRFIEQDNPKRAASFVQEIKQFTASFVDFPKRYPLQADLAANLRLAPYGPYRIYFREEATHIYIVRIMHTARKISEVLNP